MEQLINRQYEVPTIPKDVIAELTRLRERGYLLFIATGRPFTFISDTIRAFDFDGYIMCNGAHVEYREETIYHETLNPELVKPLLEKFKEWGCEYILETIRKSYLHPTFTVLHTFFLECDINIEYLHFDFEEHEVYPETLKIEASANEEKIPLVEEYLKGKFNYDQHGTDNAFEIFSANVTKAVGVQKVLDYLQIERGDSYAIGDGLNDREMLQLVGHGIAMGNAVEELKAVADVVCDHVGNNGLAKFLRTLE